MIIFKLTPTPLPAILSLTYLLHEDQKAGNDKKKIK